MSTIVSMSDLHAEPSQAPLELATQFVEPNVMIMLDSSGSMAGSRGTIAKSVLTDLINDSRNNGIRFCGSYFNKSTYIINNASGYRDGAQIDPGMGCSSNLVDKQALITTFNAITYTGGTPLAEAYYDLTRYFRHQPPYFGSFPAGIADPIISECQTNTIIVITDGVATIDWDRKSQSVIPIDLSFEQETINGVTKNLPNWDNIDNDAGPGGFSQFLYLDDLALFGYEKDMNSLPGLQNIKTHTIGFNINDPVLEIAAEYGHGIYSTANNAQELSDALQDALNNTVVDGTGTGSATSGATLTNGSDVDFYVTEYSSEGWSGELHSFELIEGNNGELETTLNWSASEQLPTFRNRKLFTSNDDALTITTPFHQSNLLDLTDNQQDDLGAARNVNGDITNKRKLKQLIKYLRGDISKAASSPTDTSKPLRYRPSLLADIIHARPVYVKNQPYGYPDSSYDTYKDQQDNRQAMVYVGANDGIFHAFNADTGEEEFGYIAATLFPKLKQYSDHNYVSNGNHRYFNDGLPTAVDAKVNNNWNTVISVPFGAGGKGLSLLNITNPTTASFDNLFMWEINDDTPLYSDMGYLINQAKITRIKDHNDNEQWVVITGNGVDSENGNAMIYIINLDDGSLRQIIELGDHEGTTSVSTVDLNADTYTDRLYATTLDGEIWRFDLEDGNFITKYGNESSPDPLFIAKDNSGTKQPITGELTVSPSPLPATANPGVIISFGTGKFYADSDLDSIDTQSFYTFWEKDFETESEYSGNLDRDNLIEHTITNNANNTTRTITGDIVDYASGSETELGWYADLPDDGERIISKPVTFFNRIVFNTINHTVQGCNDLTNRTWLMQVDRLNGGVIIPDNGYFASQPNNVMGVNKPFSSQSPQFIEHSNGTISYPTVDKDGDVDDSTQSVIEYYRSSTRQLQ